MEPLVPSPLYLSLFFILLPLIHSLSLSLLPCSLFLFLAPSFSLSVSFCVFLPFTFALLLPVSLSLYMHVCVILRDVSTLHKSIHCLFKKYAYKYGVHKSCTNMIQQLIHWYHNVYKGLSVHALMTNNKYTQTPYCFPVLSSVTHAGSETIRV